MEIIFTVLLGGVFGGILYWTGAARPEKIIDMLSFRCLKLIKIIIGAIGVSSVLFAIFNLTKITGNMNYNITPTNLGVVIGGLIFGIGLGWSGGYPSGSIVALGTNLFVKSIWLIVGGFAGALVYSFTYSKLSDLGVFDIMDMGKLTLFNISDKYSYLLPGGYIGLGVLGILSIIISFAIPIVDDK